jgi:hypothetical protein
LVTCEAPTKFFEACCAVAPTKPLPPFWVTLFCPRPMFCDCCSGLLFDPKALRPLELEPMPDPLPVPVVRLLPPNMPEPEEPPPPDMPPIPPLMPPMPPPDIPPPEPPNCPQTDSALTIRPNNNSQERFNARHMGISL